MTLQHYGVVDSEDGLLLLGDSSILQSWRGIDEEPVQAARIEAFFAIGLPGIEVPIAQKVGVIWDIEGPGTTDVFIDEALVEIRLVRCWLSEAEDETETIVGLASMPSSESIPFAAFRVDSGLLGIIAPTESGDCIHNTNASRYSLSVSDMMTESSGMLLPVLNGRYQCVCETVTLEHAEARRCHIIRLTD